MKQSFNIYSIQKLDDPFVDDINMRINQSAMHRHVPVSMQEMIRQSNVLFKVTGRCQERQSLRAFLHSNQVTICKKEKTSSVLKFHD